MARNKYVTGFVVKEETKVKQSEAVMRTVRTEVSRVYHSIDAARVFLAMAQKTNPGRHYYIHEKTKYEKYET